MVRENVYGYREQREFRVEMAAPSEECQDTFLHIYYMLIVGIVMLDGFLGWTPLVYRPPGGALPSCSASSQLGAIEGETKRLQREIWLSKCEDLLTRF